MNGLAQNETPEYINLGMNYLRNLFLRTTLDGSEQSLLAGNEWKSLQKIQKPAEGLEALYMKAWLSHILRG